MNTELNIKLTHSENRPRGQAWCADSNGRKTYAPTREDALENHIATEEIYALIEKSLRACAAACGASI